MSDEPLIPETARTRPTTMILVAILAFLVGLAVMAAVLQYRGMLAEPAPAPSPDPGPLATSPAPTPAPELPIGTDIASLAAREQALAARLDAIEARQANVDRASRTASSYATRAENLMVAFAARRALDRGLPLNFVELQLRDRFGAREPQAVATIIQAARDPVTLEDLRLALDTIGPRLASTNPDESWWRAVQRQLGDLVVLRQVSAPSPRPADRIERAHRALDSGQVEAALAEVARLPGAGNAQSWMAAARRYVDARRALATIEEAAITGPRPAPAPSPVPDKK